jgi:uncharacterized membrane protein YesL
MTSEQPTAATNPFEPPVRVHDASKPTGFGEGVLGRASEAIYWYIVLTALLLVASLPTVVLGALLLGSAANLPFIALSCVFLAPALSAGLYSVRARYTAADDDLGPARAFWRGYALNWRDVLRLWVPSLVVLGIIAVSLAYGDEAGIGALYRVVLIVIGTVVLVWSLHTVAISTFFSFRARDVARLAAYHSIMMWRTTFGVVALLIVAGAAAWFLTGFALVAIGGVWTWFWYQNDKPMFTSIWEHFTAPAGTAD